jgi:FdrA protein
MGDKLDELLQRGPVAINLGVLDFAENLKVQGAEVIHVDWNPPAGGDQELMDLLDKLL